MLEYDVHLVSPCADDAQATIKDAVVVLDTSSNGRRDAPSAAELLLTALAACVVKGVGRAGGVNHFEVGRIEVRVPVRPHDRSRAGIEAPSSNPRAAEIAAREASAFLGQFQYYGTSS